MPLELVESPVRENTLTIGEATIEDVQTEPSLRPKSLDEYIGQQKIVNNLKIFLKAALRRAEALDHCLFFGPPGLGKTSLANIIANELGANLKTVHAPSVEKGGDLAAILTNLEEGDVLFTLVGATTRAGLISAPLRGRFGIVNHLDFYPRKDLEIIAHRSAEILNIEIDANGASEIARRGRGTPRITNRLLRRVRDYAEILGDGKITGAMAQKALDEMEVDRFGLDEVDRKLLLSIIEKFDGGPVGIGTIAASISEDRESIEEVIEPYLIQTGFLNRTPRGRVVTASAYEHFGFEPPQVDQAVALAS